MVASSRVPTELYDFMKYLFARLELLVPTIAYRSTYDNNIKILGKWSVCDTPLSVGESMHQGRVNGYIQNIIIVTVVYDFITEYWRYCIKIKKNMLYGIVGIEVGYYNILILLTTAVFRRRRWWPPGRRSDRFSRRHDRGSREYIARAPVVRLVRDTSHREHCPNRARTPTEF